jgi:hypothetical protein
MRAYLILLVAIGPALTTCDDNVSVPPEPGPPETGVRLTTRTTADLGYDGGIGDGGRHRLRTFRRRSVVHSALMSAPLHRTISHKAPAPAQPSQTLTIADSEITPVGYAFTCTATSGVIGIVVEGTGMPVSGRYEATVDGAAPFLVGPRSPTYLHGVPAGVHVVSLEVAPPRCAIKTGELLVTVTVGGLVRDTVEAHLSVSCVSGTGNLRILAQTTGATPANDYHVWVCDARNYCYTGNWREVGVLPPDGELITSIGTGSYFIELDVPGNCVVEGPYWFGVQRGEVATLQYAVACN